MKRAPLDIAVVHPFYSSMGGAEALSAACIATFVQAGHRVTIYSVDSEAAAKECLVRLEPRIASLSIEFARTYTSTCRGLFGKKPAALLGYALLLRELLLSNLPLKHTFLFSTYAEIDSGSDMPSGCYIHFPLFSSLSADSGVIGGRLSRMPVARILYQRLANFIARRPALQSNACVFTNSQWTRGEISSRNPNVDPVVLYPPVRPFSQASRSTPENDATFSVLSIGRLVAYKGHAEIVSALDAASKATGTAISITFAGRGTSEDIDALTRLNRPGVSVSVALNASRTDLATLVRRAHVGISGFKYEHFGLAIAEMVASGLPVLVPDTGGQAEIFPEVELLYSSADHLVANLVNLITQPSLLERLRVAAAGRRLQFSEDRFTHTLLDSIDLHLGRTP